MGDIYQSVPVFQRFVILVYIKIRNRNIMQYFYVVRLKYKQPSEKLIGSYVSQLHRARDLVNFFRLIYLHIKYSLRCFSLSSVHPFPVKYRDITVSMDILGVFLQHSIACINCFIQLSNTKVRQRKIIFAKVSEGSLSTTYSKHCIAFL